MEPSEAAVLRQISAAVVAVHNWIESLQRGQSAARKTSPEMISAARAVRDMQDAVAALQKAGADKSR